MKTSYVVYGAGAVGGVIGARLHLAEHRVTLVARGAHLAAIRAHGLVLDAHDGRHVVRAPATSTAAEIDWTERPVVLLCVKSQQTAAALEDIAAFAPPTTVLACAQNAVVNEVAALRRLQHVYGVTVMLPATHLEPGVVIQDSHPIPGVLDIGRYPGGVDETARQISADLNGAGFESQPRSDIMAWKYRKLLTNAVGDVSAVLPEEAESLQESVRAEGHAVLAAAGIAVVTQELDIERRGALIRRRPGNENPNSLGQSLLRRTSGLEVDYRAGEVVLLGRLHGVETPANLRVQQAAHAMMGDDPHA